MTRARASELDVLASPHDGVVSQASLIRAGFRHDFAAAEVAAGRWRRLLPGIYLCGRGPASLRQRSHAAVLHAGPDAVISGAAGCALRALGTGVDDEVTLLVPRTSSASSSGFCRVVVTKAMPSSQLLRRQGHVDLPVANLPRCVADGIRRQSELNEARAFALKAIRHRGLAWDEVLAMASRPGPGAGHFRRVAREVEDGVRSPAEADVHDVMLRAARRGTFPPYLLNPEVYLDGVLLGSPDLWVPGLGLGSEIDSRQWHEETDALDRTLLRHERFDRAGLHLDHTTPGRFARDPRAHLAKLRSLVTERRELAHPEPCGLVVLARGPLLPNRTPWPRVDPSHWA